MATTNIYLGNKTNKVEIIIDYQVEIERVMRPCIYRNIPTHVTDYDSVIYLGGVKICSKRRGSILYMPNEDIAYLNIWRKSDFQCGENQIFVNLPNDVIDRYHKTIPKIDKLINRDLKIVRKYGGFDHTIYGDFAFI